MFASRSGCRSVNGAVDWLRRQGSGTGCRPHAVDSGIGGAGRKRNRIGGRTFKVFCMTALQVVDTEAFKALTKGIGPASLRFWAIVDCF